MKRKENFYFGWIFLSIYAAVLVMLAVMVPALRIQLSTLALCGNMVFSVWLAWIFLGIKRSGILLGISFAVTILLENISMRTGYPYGVFEHFLPGPRIGTVPVVIGFVYFHYCVIGWIFADLIVGSGRRKTSFFLRSAIAAIVGSAMDALYDPIGSLLLQLWRYPEGGGFFGVPFRNSLGWIINIFLTLLIYACLTGRANEKENHKIRIPHLQVLLLLLLQILPIFLSYITLPDKTVIDCTGKSWSSGDLYQTLMMFGVLVMGCFALTGVSAYLSQRTQ